MKLRISGADFLNGRHLATPEGPMLNSHDTPRVRRGPDHLLSSPPEQAPDRPVPAALVQLALAQELLDKKLARLADVLKPILAPLPPEAVPGELHPTPPQHSALVDALRSATARINGNRDLVDDLLDRLEV